MLTIHGKLEEQYRKVLETEDINFNAYVELVNLYLNDSSKTEEDYLNLAKEIINALTYYPKPMVDLLYKIEPKMVSAAYIAQFNTIRAKALNKALVTTSDESIQAGAVIKVAKYLLGQYDAELASFSYDGENANSLVLSDKFEGSEVRWDYSLDNGVTWTQTSDKIHKLSKEEIESITSENDIKIHIIGVNYDEENIYTIDIQESAGLPSTLYANDLEDKLIAAVPEMEWRYSEDDEWTLYSESEPDLTGNKTVEVRMSATGTYKTSDPVTYTFTR